jgi:hypothetical protein
MPTKSPGGKSPILAVRHIDDLTTGKVTSVFSFKRYDGAGSEIRMPRSEVTSIAKVKAALDNAGANRSSSIRAHDLERHAYMGAENTRRVVSQTGWRDGHFDFPNRVDKGAPAPIHFIEAADADPQLHPFYKRRGSAAEWWSGVAPFVRQSDVMAVAIGAVLAQPLMRFSDASEGAIFNLAGDSGAGKTLATRVAQSCMGQARKKDLTGWDNTPVGLEEILGSTEGLALIIDDAEGSKGSSADRVRTNQAAGRMAADGGRRRRSRAYESEHGLLALREPRLGLSSAEIALTAEARMQGIALKKGVLVRFIDIPIRDKDAGGVFNRTTVGTKVPLEKQALQLHGAISRNYGHPFRKYLRYLEGHFAELGQVVRDEAERFARSARKEHGKVLTQDAAPRILGKFALIAAALNLGRKAGVHDLSRQRITLAVSTCLMDAIGQLTAMPEADGEVERRLRAVLAAAPTLRRGDPLPDGAVAYKRTEKGRTVGYLARTQLAAIAVNRRGKLTP